MNWPTAWREQMERVNNAVNKLPYHADAEKYQKEDFWTSIKEDGGDCEDYAIAKLRTLLDLGWPVESLHLACCWTETEEYHAVLVVESPDGQAYMLDNRQEQPVNTDSLPLLSYRPHVVQAVGGKQEWREWKC